MQSIEDMTLEDVQGIWKGPDDAATQYFKGKMSGSLGEAMKPIVDQTLAETVRDVLPIAVTLVARGGAKTGHPELSATSCVPIT